MEQAAKPIPVNPAFAILARWVFAKRNLSERLIFYLVLTYSSGYKPISAPQTCANTARLYIDCTGTGVPHREQVCARSRKHLAQEKNQRNCISAQHRTRRLYHETPQLCFKHLD
jgi:hypothetical protein